MNLRKISRCVCTSNFSTKHLLIFTWTNFEDKKKADSLLSTIQVVIWKTNIDLPFSVFNDM